MEFIPGEQASNITHSADQGADINTVCHESTPTPEDLLPPRDTQAIERFTSWRFPATATSSVPPPAAAQIPQKPASRSTLNGGRIKVIDFAYEQTLPPVPTVPLPTPSPTTLHVPLPTKRRREVSPGHPGGVPKKSRPSQSEPIVIEHFGSSRRKAAHNRRATAKGALSRRSSTSRSGVMGKASSRDRLSSFSMTLPTTPLTSEHWPEFSSPDTEPDTEPDDEPMTPLAFNSILLLDDLLISPKESHEAEELATHRFFGQASSFDSDHEFMFPGSFPGMDSDEQGISPIDEDRHGGLSPRSELPVFMSPV